MMRDEELQESVDRSQARLEHARAELERFMAGQPDLQSIEGARKQRKLMLRLLRAGKDMAVLRNMLALERTRTGK
jgi:hypothetical protein